VAKAIADALLNNLPLAKNSVQAAQLAKCDLITDMVGEFPELQGIMGRYYALNDGYTHDVANAIEDHYKPRFAGDELPRDTSGLVLALADKLETLIGLFGIGQIPTGDKDPFALRRHALGIIRMLIERGTELDIVENEVRYSRFEYKLPADLQTLIGKSFESWCEAAERQKLPAAQSVKTGTLAVQGTHDNKLLAFFADRLFVYLRDLGYTALEVNAVLKLNPQQLSDLPKRLAAVRSFSELPESVTLAAANKRISNILKKAEGAHTVAVDTKLFSEPAEIALNNAISTITPIAVAAFSAGKYQDALSCLAHLKPQVDAFFESVMVMADDAAIRNNRIALLGSLHQLMNQVADLSELAT
jgi:glycyl-tRNA synthetase beta chain